MCLTSSGTQGKCKREKKLISLRFFFAFASKFHKTFREHRQSPTKINLFIVRRGGREMNAAKGETKTQNDEYSGIFQVQSHLQSFFFERTRIAVPTDSAHSGQTVARRREAERERIAIPAVTRPATAAQAATGAAADTFFDWKICAKYSSENRILRCRRYHSQTFT